MDRTPVPNPLLEEALTKIETTAERAKQAAEETARRFDAMKDLLIPTLLLVVMCFVLLSVISSRHSNDHDTPLPKSATELEGYVAQLRWHQLAESMASSTWFNRLSMFTGMLLILIGVTEALCRRRDVPLQYVETRLSGAIAIAIGMILMLAAVIAQQSITKWGAWALDHPVYIVPDTLDASELRRFFLSQDNDTSSLRGSVIEYTVPSAGEVEIKVSDGSGNPVRTLRERLEKGTGTTRWDGRDDSGHQLASGTYSYSLVLNGQVLDKEKPVDLK